MVFFKDRSGQVVVEKEDMKVRRAKRAETEFKKKWGLLKPQTGKEGALSHKRGVMCEIGKDNRRGSIA